MKLVAWICSVMLLGLGISVIVAWHWQLVLWLMPAESNAAMQYNTALGFVCIALAQIATLWCWRRAAQMLSTLLLLLAVFTLIQIMFAVDFGIDQLLMQHYLSVPTAGRMAPNTAICFGLVATALLIINSSLAMVWRFKFYAFLVPAIMALALVALSGHLFDFEYVYGWGSLPKMAAHTAVGFMLSALALYAISTQGWLYSHYIPSIGFAVFIAILILWQALYHKETELFQQAAKRQVAQFSRSLAVDLSANYASLQRMIKRDALRGPDSAKLLLEDNEAFRQDYHFLLLTKLSTQSSPHGIIARQLAPEMAAVQWWLGDPALITTLEIKQCPPTPGPHWRLLPTIDAVLLVATVPAATAGDCLVGVRQLAQIVDQLQQRLQLKAVPLQIWSGGRLLLEAASDGHWSAEYQVAIDGVDLDVRFIPTRQQLQPGYLPDVILISGLLLTCLIVSMLYWMEQSRQKSAKIAQLHLDMSVNFEHLQRSEQRFRKVIAAAPNAMLLSDQHGIIEFINDKTSQLFGYSSDELIGQTVEKLIPADLRTNHQQLRQQFMHTPSDRLMQPGRDLIGLHKKGHKLTLEVSLSFFQSDQGSKVLASMVDITERLKFIRQLTRVNEELSSFIYIASHDLRSPLRGIQQLACWIEEDLADSLDAETRGHLQLMRSRIQRMDKLLDDLLAYSRAGNDTTELEVVDIRSLLQEIVELLRPGKQLKLALAADLPVLFTYKVPLEIIFRNLFDNALKHHDRQQVNIAVEVRMLDGEVEFSVSDDGPGIAPEHQQRVFGMFQKLKSKDEVEGSGIGLALIQKMVRQQGCQIWLQSDGQRGSSFYFTWPIGQQEAADEFTSRNN